MAVHKIKEGIKNAKAKGEKEKNVETYLKKRIDNLGGIAYKFVSPSNSGVPDRIVLMPNSRIFFVELKSPEGESTSLQDTQQKKIDRLGFQVFVIYSKAGVDEFIRQYVGVR